MATSTKWQYLERDPKSSYTQLSIKGRRIRARTLYGCYKSEDEPQTIEEIAKDRNLPVEAVREAIAYCETEPPEIERDFRYEEAIMEASGMNEPGYRFNPRPREVPAAVRAHPPRNLRRAHRMNLYLDDDSCHGVLANLLRQGGHDVVDPMQAGIPGENDPVHLAWTIRQRRVLMSKNHRDFQELHLLILACGGHHPGVMMVRQDNDRARDLTPCGIVVAIRNFVASETPTADSFIILNHWR